MFLFFYHMSSGTRSLKVIFDMGIDKLDDRLMQPALISFHRQYVLVADVPGLQQVVPRQNDATSFSFFLPAGADLLELDFGFRPFQATGQSSDSLIRGRVVRDSNGNGAIDDEDQGVPGQTVYLDGNMLGQRDFNDVQTQTDLNGYYEFSGLSSTVTPVRLVLGESQQQITPLGSSLQLRTFPLADIEKREGNPQSLAAADFDGDGFQDIAVIMAETNRLSIRFNDGDGGFRKEKLDLDLARSLIGAGLLQNNVGIAPTSLVVGNFDSNPAPDVAITANFLGKVLVLWNFDLSLASRFTSFSLVNARSEPIDLASGDFNGDEAIDLVVVNKGDRTVQVLLNDGDGNFAPSIAVDTGSRSPVSIVAADFDGDERLDVAVTHSQPLSSSTTFGSVTVLLGDGSGGLVHDGRHLLVQAVPLDSAIGDFNRDGKPDLAVVNFSSQSISVLRNVDGQLEVQSEILGTAQGSQDLRVVDIDGDGDEDVLASKLQQREILIFRNVGIDPATGEIRFEPGESIGVGQFSIGERMPFVVTNMDRDTSLASGVGTQDIVAVPTNTDTLYVLRNTLVQGSRRVAVTGAASDLATGIDFLIQTGESSVLALQSGGEELDVTLIEEADFARVHTIDIRGTGANRLWIDATRISQLSPDHMLRVIANEDDEVTFDSGWRFQNVTVDAGRVMHVFVNGDAGVTLIGPRDWTNPVLATDVNGDGDGTAGDALAIINALRSRRVVDEEGRLVNPNDIDLTLFKFYDPNKDGRMSSGDALFVINRLRRLPSVLSEQAIGIPVLRSLSEPGISEINEFSQGIGDTNIGDLPADKVMQFTPREHSCVPRLVKSEIHDDEFESVEELDLVLTANVDWRVKN